MSRIASSLVLVALIAAAACSSNDDAEPSASASTAATSPTIETTMTTAPPSEVELPAGETGAEQLEALRSDPDADPLDPALAEWSALVAPLPGARTITYDDSLFPSATHALIELEASYDQLTPEQQAALDAQLDVLFDESEAVDGFMLFDDPSTDTNETDSDADQEGLLRPQGIRASGSPATPADPALRNEILAMGEEVRAALGGPELTIWVEIHPPGSLGDDLARNTGMAGFSDRRRDLLRRGVDVDCLMRITEFGSPEERLGVLVHEIVHCWQFNQLFRNAGRMVDMDDWIKEGMAAYFGEKFGGKTRFNAEWWGGYLSTRLDGDNTWNTFERTYDAIGLWARIDEGSALVPAMINSVAAAPDNGAMFAAATNGLGDAQSWLAAGAVQKPEWGPGWTASGPGLPTSPRTANTVEVDPIGGEAFESQTVGPAAQRTTTWLVGGIDGARGSVMTLVGGGAGVMRVEDADSDVVIPPGGNLTDDWCLGECLCPDESSPFPANKTLPVETRLTSALVGRPTGESGLVVEVRVFDPSMPRWDCDQEPDLGDPVLGLVGTWRANPNSVAMVLEQASGFGGSDAPAIDVAGADGSVLMTFNEDGTGTLAYQEVTFFLNDSPIAELTINGEGSFNWGGDAPDLRISGITYAFAVTSLGPEPLVISSDDVPAVGVTTLEASLAGDQLALVNPEGTAGQVFFPISWTRQ